MVLYGVALVALFFSWRADREKTRKALVISRKSLATVSRTVVVLAGTVGLLTALVPPGFISRYLGERSGTTGRLAAAVLGAVTLIPGLVAFPLAGSL